MFVNRDEERQLVASFHFPAASGRSRQIKITASILEFFRDRDDSGSGLLRVDEERVFDDQALVDFEKICVNFMLAALPELRKSAYLLSRLNPQRAISDEAVSSDSAADKDDGLKEYIVNVGGWPRTRPRFRMHDVVRLYPGHVKRDVDAGYLVRVDELKPNETAEGTSFGQIIAAYRKSREVLTRRRPVPTDMGTLLGTSEGRKIRDQLAEAFAGIAAKLFPPPVGRPPALSAEAREALIAELLEDFHARRAQHVKARHRVTRAAIFAEMAADGKYGSNGDSFTAPTIERLLKGRMSGNQRQPAE